MQAVSQWQSKLERLHPEVGAVIAEEREEREIRKAEMEATKAQNMLDHEAEIYSRPARTWFQSSKEKAAAAARAKASEVRGRGWRKAGVRWARVGWRMEAEEGGGEMVGRVKEEVGRCKRTARGLVGEGSSSSSSSGSG